MKQLLLLGAVLFITSCGDEAVPKPKAYLRLDYPTPDYNRSTEQLPFSFDMNSISQIEEEVKYNAEDGSIGVNIDYPKLLHSLHGDWSIKAVYFTGRIL